MRYHEIITENYTKKINISPQRGWWLEQDPVRLYALIPKKNITTITKTGITTGGNPITLSILPSQNIDPRYRLVAVDLSREKVLTNAVISSPVLHEPDIYKQSCECGVTDHEFYRDHVIKWPDNIDVKSVAGLAEYQQP